MISLPDQRFPADRIRYVAVSPFAPGAVLTPYRSHVFPTRRYYTALHWAGGVAFVAACWFGGLLLGAPR